MFKVIVALSLIAAASAGNLGLAYSSPVLAAPVAHVAHVAPVAHVAHVAPVATSYQNTYKVSKSAVPVVSTYAAAPVIKTVGVAHAPVLSTYAAAPVIKTLGVAHAPVVSAYASPALSYGHY